MAITQSAKKAIRNSARKHVFNMRRADALKKTVKEFRALVAAKKTEAAAAMLPKAYQVIDKAAKTHYINANAASRYKSRLALAVKKMAGVK